MKQRQIDLIQQDWITEIAQDYVPALHIGCGMKPIWGAVNVDPNPARRQWVDVAADAHRLPFRDGSFSSVVSSHVMEHLCAPVAALREQARVLCSGGIVGHVIPDHRYTPHQESTRYPFAQHHHEWRGPEEFRAVLDMLGDVLDVLELRKFPRFDWSFRVLAVRL